MWGSQHPAPIYICVRINENVSLAHSAWSFFPVVVVRQMWAEVTYCPEDAEKETDRQTVGGGRGSEVLPRHWCCHRQPPAPPPPAQSKNHREQGEAAVTCRGRCRCMRACEPWMLSDSLIDVMSKVRQACLVLPWNISSGTDRLRWWSVISCHVLLCT